MRNDPQEPSGMHDGAHSSVFKNAAKLRADMTESEKKLWEYLKTKPNGYKFRRQHPIGRYILDFYCHELRLSIELDGEYHLAEEQRQKDEERTEYLNDLGIMEPRFKNDLILTQFESWIDNFNTRLCEGSPFRAGEGEGNKQGKP